MLLHVQRTCCTTSKRHTKNPPKLMINTFDIFKLLFYTLSPCSTMDTTKPKHTSELIWISFFFCWLFFLYINAGTRVCIVRTRSIPKAIFCLPQHTANPITGTFIKWILINDPTICQANAISYYHYARAFGPFRISLRFWPGFFFHVMFPP